MKSPCPRFHTKNLRGYLSFYTATKQMVFRHVATSSSTDVTNSTSYGKRLAACTTACKNSKDQSLKKKKKINMYVDVSIYVSLSML